MVTVAVPTAGDPVRASWGEDVADAINNTHDDRLPFVNAMGLHQSTNQVTNSVLAAESASNAGALIIPFWVPCGIEVVGYSIYQTAAANARECEFALYKDTGSTTLVQVTGSAAALGSFTPSAADVRRVTLTGGNIVIPPGVYWLAIRNTSTSQTFAVGAGANTADWSDSSADNHCARELTTASVPALGATLDISSFTAADQIFMARLDGAVFGESARF